ncbi:MAG: DNA replication/repair protein RecF [Oscillospiraceae bacterium]|nr:DNA replication/repair protein RecF [Oscillospiraceae bacterium]MCL2279681.1 DNA replication/repair protein RecF [Oscillospiraceae bacterium]
MTVERLYLDCFRNYQKCTVEFLSAINVICGKNAQGKTNLIEAIYYLATGRTFRSVGDKELINFDFQSASIRADIVSSEREQKLEARFSRDRRRELYVNDVKIKKGSELTGRLTVVLFCPDDLTIIKDGASVRRKLMDSCLSQLRPAYHATLSEFNRLYDHKTRILKDHHEKPGLLELLDDHNLRLAELSAKLIYYRAAFAGELSKRASIIHKDFSDGREYLEINYKTVGGMDASNKKPDELLPQLLLHQEKHKIAEIRSGQCLSGAHKDDLEIFINKIAARKFASQGQARTAAVSIKLAERDIHYEDKREYPVLLLDDVLSELDPKRQSFVLERIENGQVFITCCDDAVATFSGGAKTIEIEDGRAI